MTRHSPLFSLKSAILIEGQEAKACPAEGRYQRLLDICAELNMLFAYRIGAEACFAQMSKSGELVFVLGKSIGRTLSVEIERETGRFVLYEEDGPNSCIFVTASDERLVDRIISVAHGSLTPKAINAAVDALIGQSIEEVEFSLILQTMRHFQGSASKAAFALGVSENELIALMRHHLITRKTSLVGAGGRQ